MPLFGLSKPDVEKMEAKRDVEGLIKALAYKKEDVRRCAAIALGKIGDARAVDVLIVSLKDQDYLVQGNARVALEKIGGEHTVDKLVAALGQYSEAIECCDKALEINSNNKLALTIKERIIMKHPPHPEQISTFYGVGHASH